MIDQVKTPENFNPARKIYGIVAVAEFIRSAAFPQQKTTHKTVHKYIKVGLLRPAIKNGSGSVAGLWLAGDVIDDIKEIAAATQVAQGRPHNGAWKWSLTEIKEIMFERRWIVSHRPGKKPSRAGVVEREAKFWAHIRASGLMRAEDWEQCLSFEVDEPVAH